MKRCVLCGKEFIPKCNAQKICGEDHFTECPICGKKMIWNSTQAAKPCSVECSNALRKQTVLQKYGVENIAQARPHRASHSYNNFKYIQSMDKRYAELWASYGIDVWKVKESGHTVSFHNIIDPSVLSVYVISSTMRANEDAERFLFAQGVQTLPKRYNSKRCVTLMLSDGNIPVQAVRIGLSKYKGFDCQLLDYGRIVGHDIPGGYRMLISTFREIYDVESMIAEIDHYDGIDIDMCEMCFAYQFSRPGLVYWNNEEMYKRTHDVQEKLDKGCVPVIHPIRKVFSSQGKIQ